MSRHRSSSSPIAPVVTLILGLACTPGAPAATAGLDGYLRCVERERDATGRDASAFDALLRIERRAICFRLHSPTRDAPTAANDARRVAGADPCAGAAGRRAMRARQAWERRGVLLRAAADRAKQDAMDARAIGVGMAGDQAAYALRVATDLEAQSRALQRYVDSLHPDWPEAAGETTRRGDAACHAGADKG